MIVEQIGAKLMSADPLTKGLRHTTFKKHVINMEVLESFDVLGQ